MYMVIFTAIIGFVTWPFFVWLSINKQKGGQVPKPIIAIASCENNHDQIK